VQAAESELRIKPAEIESSVSPSCGKMALVGVHSDEINKKALQERNHGVFRVNKVTTECRYDSTFRVAQSNINGSGSY